MRIVNDQSSDETLEGAYFTQKKKRKTEVHLRRLTHLNMVTQFGIKSNNTELGDAEISRRDRAYL
jgi:hypothetical protein